MFNIVIIEIILAVILLIVLLVVLKILTSTSKSNYLLISALIQNKEFEIDSYLKLDRVKLNRHIKLCASLLFNAIDYNCINMLSYIRHDSMNLILYIPKDMIFYINELYVNNKITKEERECLLNYYLCLNNIDNNRTKSIELLKGLFRENELLVLLKAKKEVLTYSNVFNRMNGYNLKECFKNLFLKLSEISENHIYVNSKKKA